MPEYTIVDPALNKGRQRLPIENWCRARVEINGVQTTVSVGPVKKLIEAIQKYQPANQEDWKAMYWMVLWGSEKPSNVEKVIIQNENGYSYVWHEPRLTTE